MIWLLWIFLLFSSPAVAQCNGLFPANSYCGSGTLGGFPPAAQSLGAGNFNFTGTQQYPIQSGINVYANPSTGNDSNDCLAATVTGGHGPCLTVSHAVSVLSQFDVGGAPATVNLAAGTYTTGFLWAGFLRGGSNSNVFNVPLIIQGAGSSTTIMDDNTSNCATVIVTGPNSLVILSGVTVQKTLSGNSGCGSALFIQNQAAATLTTDVAFGVALANHINMEQFANMEQDNNYTIKGNAVSHIAIGPLAHFGWGGMTVTCSGVTAFSGQFLFVTSGSYVTALNGGQVGGTNFSGCGSVTGKRVELLTGGHVDTGGATSLSFIPGNTFGVIDATSHYTPEPTTSLGTCTNGSIDNNSTIYNTKVNFTGANSSCAVTFPYNLVNNPTCVPGTQGGTITSITPTNAGWTVTGTFANTNSLFVLCRPLNF